jgi:hypothetical protein
LNPRQALAESLNPDNGDRPGLSYLFVMAAGNMRDA